MNKQSLQVFLDLKLTTKLTVELRQSIGLLQLSNQDLNSLVQEQLSKNPILSLSSNNNLSNNPNNLNNNLNNPQNNNSNNLNNLNNPDNFNKNLNNNKDNNNEAFDKLTQTPNYIDYREDLMSQARLLRTTPLLQALVSYLIQALDERGFLNDSWDDLLQDLHKLSPELSLNDLQKAQKLLMNLNPCGVGARDIFEYLNIVLQEKSKTLGINQRAKLWTYQIAQQFLKHVKTQLELKKDKTNLLRLSLSPVEQKKIAKQLGVTIDKLNDAVAILRQLPTQAIQTPNLHAFTRSDYILPDIIISEHEFHTTDDLNETPDILYRANLNEALIPKLSMNLSGINLTNSMKSINSMKSMDTEESSTSTSSVEENSDHENYMKNKIQEARWLISSIEKRFDTLKKLATLIVSEQQMFFKHGDIAMQPMTMQKIADQLGIHVSTVSRIVSNKYLQCRLGTYALKHFFSKEITSRDGRVCSVAVKQCIKDLINNDIEEGKSSNDTIIAQKLWELGLNISRRTVAKYRRELGIQATYSRAKTQTKTKT